MNDFDAKMRVLQSRFVARCPEWSDTLRQVLSPVDHAEVARIAHQVAGSAGIFGFPELSTLAKELERSALAAQPDGDVRRRGAELVEILKMAARMEAE